MTLLFLLLPLATVALETGVCPNTPTCIARIREVVAEPKRFWFGEHRRTQCTQRHSSSADCFGPAHLFNFHSVGSRLFQVRTYHAAYLRNLMLFPRITFRGAPGHYRACEHEYQENNAVPIEADPLMKPVAPFQIRNRPEIDWFGLQYNDEYTLIMTDVGSGTLNYMVVDFPHKTKRHNKATPTVSPSFCLQFTLAAAQLPNNKRLLLWDKSQILKEYEPSDNFRSMPNPLVLLVFKKGELKPNLTNPDDWNLVDFMTTFSLEDNLVGLNLVVVGSDPFAIERQRMRGNVDNCHSLLQQKLREDDSSLPVLLVLPTEEISQWLSVSFQLPDLHIGVCCHRFNQEEGKTFLDPLGSSNISALSTLSPPTFTSLRVASTASSYLNYHRHTRTYLALMDDLFTLVLVDGQTGKLHWMLVDISASELGTDGQKGITKASYHALTPADPATCRQYVFILLEQTGSMNHLQSFCNDDCFERKEFNVESFRQQYGLKLTALSWTSSCYDLPYAYFILRQTQNTTSEPSRSSKRLYRQSDASQEICSAFKVSSSHRCTVSSSRSTRLILTILIVLVEFL